MIFRRAEMAILEQIRTTVAAMPIPKAATTEVEMAKVGQVPSTSTRTGFSLIRPLRKICSLLIFVLLI